MTMFSELVDDVKFIIKFRRKYTRLQKQLDKKAPKAGGLAPDFTLTDSCGTNTVMLSQFRSEKLVALVFGSYT